MESPETRHDRYRLAPTAGVETYEYVSSTLQNNLSTIVPEQILQYNRQIQNGDRDHDILNALCTELCCEYQERIRSKVRCIPTNFDDSGAFFKGIIEILLNNVRNLNEKTQNLLLDILVLEMVLYAVNDEIKLITATVMGTGDEITLKIISSLIDALYLNPYIHEGNGGNQSGLIQITEPLRKVLQPTPDATGKYFALLSSTIRKMIVTFSTDDVMYFLWSSILADEHGDCRDRQLKLLTIAFDSILSVKNDISVVYICRDEFWRLICYGLMSDAEEQQKQALYLMKETLNYVENEGITVKKGSLMPFVGCRRDDGQFPVQEMKAQFLSMIESLVGNQAGPTVKFRGFYRCLILGSRAHRTCGNCFNVMYLTCIFKRIFKHKSTVVVRKGFENIILMDTFQVDNELLTIMIEALNHPPLYSPGSTSLSPDIVQCLGKFLYYSDEKKDALMNRFICTAATRDWDPIPFFYIIKTLAVAVSQSNEDFEMNIWTLKEYRAVIKMIEKHIGSQTLPLQEVIANNMSKIVSRCAGAEIGLDSIALILFALGYSFDYDSSDNGHLPTDVHGLCHLNYTNNPKVWRALIDYLEEEVSDEDALAYVRRCCTELSGSTSTIDAEYFAVMICLLAEAGKDFSPSSAYGEPLSRVFTAVRDMHARPHADTRVLIKIMELFTCLKRHAFNESTVQAFMIACPSLIPLISSWQESFWQIIMNSLDSSRIPKTFAEAKQYIACFDAISPKSGEEDFPPEFVQFFQTAWKIIGESAGEVDVRYWYALHIVGVCNRHEICSDYTTEQINIFWAAFMDTRPLKLVRAEDYSREAVKIISECCGIISELIVNNILQRIDSTNFNTVLSRFYNLVENGKEYVILQFNVLREITKGIEGLTYCRDLQSAVIELSWKILWNCEKSNLFWKCLRCLIRMMIYSVGIGYPLSSTTGINHIETMMLLNTRYQKMILVPEIYRELIRSLAYRRVCKAQIIRLWQIPLTCFLENNADKIEANLHKLYRETFNGRSCREKYTDVGHKVCCISAILYEATRPWYFNSIVDTLISKLKEFEGKQYVANSRVHRQKHRIMQLLLLSHLHWSKATVESVHDNICHFIIHETDLPSVRVMQEWLLALIYIKNPTIRERVFELLQDGKNKRRETIVSIVAVIYYMALSLSGEEHRSFLEKVINALRLCCQTQSLIIRPFIAESFSNIVQEIRKEVNMSRESFVDEAVQENMPHVKVEKNSVELSEDFLCTSFDPIENFDLQTIFYDLPRLLGMSMDECIHPSHFKDYEDVIKKESKIKVENPESKLSSMSTPHHLLERRESNVEDTVNSTSEVVANIGLIVVGSLIDGMLNLGELARAAETFCVKELVLSSLACTQNPEFQSLSLSSEKKIILSEVKPEKLEDYLVEKISSGWSLVGAEQTSTSVNLQDMIFSKKTVLLLGNETNGIPANLIPLLDVCVKIPTAGVGSLNAHVTGAFCMWQYAKQFIF